MTTRSDELDTFKTEIDLVAYAQGQGYAIDQRRKSRTSIAMRHEGAGDRIIVALKHQRALPSTPRFTTPKTTGRASISARTAAPALWGTSGSSYGPG